MISTFARSPYVLVRFRTGIGSRSGRWELVGQFKAGAATRAGDGQAGARTGWAVGRVVTMRTKKDEIDRGCSFVSKCWTSKIWKAHRKGACVHFLPDYPPEGPWTHGCGLIPG